MSLAVAVEANDFGAIVRGLDLNDLDDTDVRGIRSLWLQHQVVAFPNQPMTHEQLIAFTRKFGEFGKEPYVAPIQDNQHILEIRREPDEAVSPFGAAWHSDWSFQQQPPAATILHAKVVPPAGGDTLFADGYRAFAALPDHEQAYLKTLTALHSARRPYSHEGYRANGSSKRSMTILPSDAALDVIEHPLIRTHPETGRDVLWINAVYTIGIKDMAEVEARALLDRLFAFSTREQFIYRHRWSANMLTMWDNRSVQHCAQGGYDGHRRIMHRTTVAGDTPYLAAVSRLG